MMSDGWQRIAKGEYLSYSTEATIALGHTLGSVLAAGDVLVLTGDLGAGKTQLTKGIALGMNIAADITSPTFTIEMVYEGSSFPLYHFDLYRLTSADQLEDTGLFDVLGGDGPCVIEWGEQFIHELGDDLLSITLTRNENTTLNTNGEPARYIRFTGTGQQSCALIDSIDEALLRCSI